MKKLHSESESVKVRVNNDRKARVTNTVMVLLQFQSLQCLVLEKRQEEAWFCAVQNVFLVHPASEHPPAGDSPFV